MSHAERPARTLVVDDERPARELLRHLLETDPEIELLDDCKNGQEAVARIRAERPDLLFLDVQMPEVDGFGVLAELAPDDMPLVVFVTAYDQYAVQAFEVHAQDYLLKPFDDQRFHEALARAKAALRQRDIEHLSDKLVHLLQDVRQEEGQRVEAPVSRLTVRSSGKVTFIKTDDIDWIEAADYYARIHSGGKGHLLRESLSSLEERLDAERFARIHRSAIVNLDRVKEMRPLFKGSWVLILEDGTRLKISRQRRAELEARLRC